MKSLSFSAFLIVLLLQFNSSAQILPGAKQISLSHSTIALSHDVFAHFSNPAGLAQLGWREFGAYYSPAPFGLTELANGYGVYLEPTEFGSISAGFMTYGFELYRENIISFSYANKINNLLFGITAKYNNISIRNYGNDGTISILIGGLIYISNNLRSGFAIDNITRSSIGSADNQIPTSLHFGFSYDLLEETSINASYLHEVDLNPSLNFGIDYQIIPLINIRFGFMSYPSSFSGGIGINYSLFELDYAVFNHQDLGLTHQAGLIIHFSEFSSRIRGIKEYLNIE